MCCRCCCCCYCSSQDSNKKRGESKVNRALRAHLLHSHPPPSPLSPSLCTLHFSQQQTGSRCRSRLQSWLAACWQLVDWLPRCLVAWQRQLYKQQFELALRCKHVHSSSSLWWQRDTTRYDTTGQIRVSSICLSLSFSLSESRDDTTVQNKPELALFLSLWIRAAISAFFRINLSLYLLAKPAKISEFHCFNQFYSYFLNKT